MSIESTRKISIRNIESSNFSNSPKKTNDLYTKVSSLISLNLLAEIGIVSSIGLGGMITFSAKNLKDAAEGMLIAGLSCSLICTIWGIALINFGNKTTGLKVLAFAWMVNCAAAAIIQEQPKPVIHSDSETLRARVKSALVEGGRIKKLEGQGVSEAYQIFNQNEPIALFKPDQCTPTYCVPQLAEKQFLATKLDLGTIARPPVGAIEEISSEQFNKEPYKIENDCEIEPELMLEADLTEMKKLGLVCNVAANQQTSIIKKRGYLQEWISGAVSLNKLYPHAGNRFDGLPLLYKVPLSEYQIIGIRDFLIYNRDRHPGNILIKEDMNQIPHMIPIDMDLILPDHFDKLIRNNTVIGGKRYFEIELAKRFFTPYVKKIISEIKMSNIATLIHELNLSKNIEIKMQVLAFTLKMFAEKNLTLYDLYSLIAQRRRLWDLVDLTQSEPGVTAENFWLAFGRQLDKEIQKRF